MMAKPTHIICPREFARGTKGGDDIIWVQKIRLTSRKVKCSHQSWMVSLVSARSYSVGQCHTQMPASSSAQEIMGWRSQCSTPATTRLMFGVAAARASLRIQPGNPSHNG